MLIVSITILKGVLQFELISDSDHDLQPDSDSIDDVSSNRLCSQSRVEPAREPQPKPKSRRRLRMTDEDENGVRVKVIPCSKEQLRRRLQQTNRLGDDFFMPNRAQLMLDFLKKHGDRLVKRNTLLSGDFPQLFSWCSMYFRQDEKAPASDSAAPLM